MFRVTDHVQKLTGAVYRTESGPGFVSGSAYQSCYLAEIIDATREPPTLVRSQRMCSKDSPPKKKSGGGDWVAARPDDQLAEFIAIAYRGP